MRHSQSKTLKMLQLFLKMGVIALLLLSLALIYFFTLSFDEAWLMSNYIEIFEGVKSETKFIPISLTNGGVFALTGVILYSLFGIHIWIYRLISYISLVTISYLLWRWSMLRWSNVSASLIVLAVFLGMWGAVELGALAYGGVAAMMLLLVGLHIRESGEDHKNMLRTCLLTGLFLGLASSSRLNLLAIFPAIFFESLLSPVHRKKRVKEFLYIALAGLASFLFCQLLVIYISPTASDMMLIKSLESTGLGALWLDYPRIFNKWIVANGFLPFFFMIATSAYAFFDTSKYSRAIRTLILFGWLHWAAWLIRAPIAHLRYLWPTIAAFSIVAGFGLASFYVWAKENSRPALCCMSVAVALGFATMGFVSGFRSLIHGEADILSWEWSRQTPLSKYRWIRYQPFQNKMAEYLTTHMKRGEEVGVLGLDLGIEILSGVKVVPIKYYFDGDAWNGNPLPKKILITPIIGHLLYMDPAVSQWMEDNLKKEAQFGRYILYQVEGSYPEKSNIFKYYYSPHPHYPHADPFFKKG